MGARLGAACWLLPDLGASLDGNAVLSRRQRSPLTTTVMTCQDPQHPCSSRTPCCMLSIPLPPGSRPQSPPRPNQWPPPKSHATLFLHLEQGTTPPPRLSHKTHLHLPLRPFLPLPTTGHIHSPQDTQPCRLHPILPQRTITHTFRCGSNPQLPWSVHSISQHF